MPLHAKDNLNKGWLCGLLVLGPGLWYVRHPLPGPMMVFALGRAVATPAAHAPLRSVPTATPIIRQPSTSAENTPRPHQLPAALEKVGAHVGRVSRVAD